VVGATSNSCEIRRARRGDQGLYHFADGGVALERVLRHTPLERRVHRRAHAFDLGRDVLQDARGLQHDRPVDLERGLAGQHGVDDARQRELIGARIHRLPRDLLGRHVPDGPDHHVHRRQLGRLAQLGHPEVEHLHLPVVGEEDVLRLQIAVGDVARMRRLERRRHLLRDLERLDQLHPPAIHARAERLTVEELEHDVGQPVVGDVVVDQLDDVGVLERGDDLRLATEAGQRLGVVGELVAQELDREALGHTHVPRFVDGGHAALRHEALDPVRLHQHLPDPLHARSGL
jgi:hypothetical protein